MISLFPNMKAAGLESLARFPTLNSVRAFLIVEQQVVSYTPIVQSNQIILYIRWSFVASLENDFAIISKE